MKAVDYIKNWLNTVDELKEVQERREVVQANERAILERLDVVEDRLGEYIGDNIPTRVFYVSDNRVIIIERIEGKKRPDIRVLKVERVL